MNLNIESKICCIFYRPCLTVSSTLGLALGIFFNCGLFFLMFVTQLEKYFIDTQRNFPGKVYYGYYKKQFQVVSESA